MKSLFGFTSIICVTALAVFFVAGCSSDDDGPANPGTPDTSPPVVSSVTAVHSHAVEVTFNESVTRSTAERVENYTLTDNLMAAVGSQDHRGDNRSPSAEINIISAALHADGRTVLLSTLDGMVATDYDLNIEKISDVHGNTMTESSTTNFPGKDQADDTPPTITTHNPASGATGIGTAQSVFVTFSEPMQSSTVYSAFSWSVTGGGGVSFGMNEQSANLYVFTAVSPIENNRTYNISISSAARDWANNSFAGTSWSFKTGSTPDTTPPALVSSTPANGATGVAVDVVLKIEFSEPVNPLSAEGIVVTPEINNGLIEWIDGGKTLVATPDYDLLANTQYALTLPEGAIEDMSGNAMTETVTILFTTGTSFAVGSIAGTISGDPFSVTAADPTGAIVVATTTNLFGRVEEGDPDIYGSGTVGADDSYLVGVLPDNVYYPFAIMDSNHDGILNPELGDAIGAYGVDIENMDDSADPVIVSSGAAVPGIGFPLFDPHAIFGTVLYAGGTYSAQLYHLGYVVGAFDVDGFDPENIGSPRASTEGGSLGQDPVYRMDTFKDGLMAGTYYLHAFLDVNGDGWYDPGVEPGGFYSNPYNDALLPVTIENGSDAGRIDIYLQDPATATAPPRSSGWTALPFAGDDLSLSVRRAQAAIRRALNTLDGNQDDLNE